MKYRNPKTWNDRWMIEHVCTPSKHGFFVEAGALDGICGSSTYLLEKDYGWKGILVEPDSDMFEQLVSNRPNSDCLDCCLYDTNGEIDFVQFKLKGWSGIAENWPETRQVRPETDDHKIIKRQTLTLEKLLEKFKATPVIDYLALDIERSEFKILKEFPFDSYKFKAISLEGYVDSKKILQNNGYVQVANPFSEVYHEGYFIHKDYIEINYKL